MKKEEKTASIGKKVILLRKQQGLSQKELAEKCGLHPQSLERLENNKVNPGVEFLIDIADGLNCKVRDLIDF